MDGRNIEPRKVMWAVAEVSWSDGASTPNRAAATIEDMSVSGACIRVKAPIGIGARLTVKWHREQFSAITRNCRRDGMDFILGVRRDPNASENPTASKPEASPPRSVAVRNQTAAARSEINHPDARAATVRKDPVSSPKPAPGKASSAPSDPQSGPQDQLPPKNSSAAQERKVMTTKKLFPQFWRRQPEGDAPNKAIPPEAPVNKTHDFAAGPVGGPTELLSYDDIYHAAGIMSPRSGYGIHKVVEMLNSERIRELSKDVQRASVLMALEAAGASADELLQDATRRQQALNSYEEGQRKQVEEFETRKTQESASIQAEMERITAHYTERIQRNREQVAREKESLRNWQMAKQHESQRICEVIDLCAKQPAAAAAAGQSSGDASAALRPTLLSNSNRS